MKKTILQAIIFSLTIHVLIIGFQIVQGYLLTKFHSPSIINAYDNVHILQDEVAFGIIHNSGGIVLFILSFLVGMGCFIVGKYVFVRLRSKGLER